MSIEKMEDILAQMRAVEQAAKGQQSNKAEAATNAEGQTFADALKTMVDNVDSQQKQAKEAAQAFTSGDPDANLHEVMLSLQKANISFKSMVEVRNKLVDAYRDVMNTQV